MSENYDGHADFRAHLRGASGFRQELEWPGKGGGFFFGLGEATFSLYAPDGWAYRFDLEGRLRRAASPGGNYIRGLDGAVLKKIVCRKGAPRGRGAPEPAQVRELYARTHAAVSEALEALRGAGLWDEPVSADASELLSRAASYDPDRLEGEARRFREAYDPLGILPPDRYRALILQATSGCSWGKCKFCSLYRGVPYRRKSPAEFREHALGVKAFLGLALRLKSGVFLGEANALQVPFEDLREIFRIVLAEFPEQVASAPGKRGGISAFSDVFGRASLDPSELAELAAMGLDRVYLGIESGDEGVLRSLGKPAARDLIQERVRELKAAGISVGAIFLVGAGRRRSREHVEGTVSLVASLPLDARDVVYLSPLVARKDGRNPDERLEIPPREAIEREARELTERLRALGVKVGRYDLDSFVYY